MHRQTWDLRVIAIATLVFLICIALVGVGWVVKFQLFLLFLLCFSILSLRHRHLSQARPRPGVRFPIFFRFFFSFFFVFDIFFVSLSPPLFFFFLS